MNELITKVRGMLDERLGTENAFKEFAEHPVPRHAINPFYCLGGLTFLSFLIQIFTGIFLAMYFRPTPAEAYASIEMIMNEVRFGAIIRSIHHWTANMMVIFVFLHMLRVYYTGAFKKPRELNWVTGAIILTLVLAISTTGYSLAWEQISYWAMVVLTESMAAIPIIGEQINIVARGGLKISETTLSRFFVIHTAILPATILALLGLHFVMIRIQGIADEY